MKRPSGSLVGRVLVLFLVAFFAVGFEGLLPWEAAHRAWAEETRGGLTAEGQRQIAALLAEKESRTPAQRKIDSNLLYAMKTARGQIIAAGVATLESGVEVDLGGLTDVEIRAEVSTDLLAEIERLGGRTVRAFEFARSVRARLPIGTLERLASRPDVSFIAPPSPARLANPRREVSAEGTPAAVSASGPLVQALPGAGFEGPCGRLRGRPGQRDRDRSPGRVTDLPG